MGFDGNVDKRLMVTEVVVFQKLSVINAVILGNLEAGCFIISVHQLIGQVWYNCIHNVSAFQICPSHYRLVCTTRFQNMKAMLKGRKLQSAEETNEVGMASLWEGEENLN
jgi:hypothetical protein